MKESICNNVSIILVKLIHYITEKRQHRQCIKDIGIALAPPPPPKKKKTRQLYCYVYLTFSSLNIIERWHQRLTCKF